MPSHLSASDLASLAVPGLPKTKRGIASRCVAEHWAVASGPRSGNLIDVNALPQDIRAAIHAVLQSRLTQPLGQTTFAPKTGAGRPVGTGFFDRHPHVGQAVTSYLAVHAFAATTLLEHLSGAGVAPLPPIHTLRRFVARTERESVVLLTAMRDPDAAKSKYRLALGRADATASYAHEFWELDTTEADVMTANGRRMILGVIDRWSRRARFIVANSESAQSVRALLMRAITDWGVIPGTIVVDNGSGYINATVKTACEMLGIGHQPCLPGSPELKPFIERLLGTFTRQRNVILPGFTGHNVAQAQQLRARNRKTLGKAEIYAEITAEDLQAILDNWTIGVYEQRAHGGIGMSPLAKAMRSPVPAVAAPDALTLRRALTAFVGNQLITKRGLRWKGQRYMCPELVPYIGKPVHVRRDEADLGALLVFDENGSFIGTAVNYERAGLSEQQFAVASRNHQRAHDKQAKAELREVMKRFPIEKARAGILRADAEAAGKLIQLHPQPPRAAQSKLQDANDGQTATVHTLPVVAAKADIASRVSRAETLIARSVEGHDVPDADLAWAQAFALSAAFQSFKAAAAYARGETPIILMPTKGKRT